MALCLCGCGQEVMQNPKTPHRHLLYIHGHYAKTHSPNKGNITSTRRIPPNTLCGCGCGVIVPEYKPSGGARYCRSKDGKFYFKGHHKQAKGSLNPAWKGGRMTSKQGYVYLLKPEHPDADRDGYIEEHRFTWEQTHGRQLTHNEHVHHINGIKDDNRPENLVALTIAEHHKLHVAQDQNGHIWRDKKTCSDAGKKGADARWHKMLILPPWKYLVIADDFELSR